MTKVSLVSRAQCSREVTPSTQPSSPQADQLRVGPNRAWCRHLWQLPQPCQAHPGWIHGGRGKNSKLFYFLAWAASVGLSTRGCCWHSVSGVPDVHSVAKDVVPIWTIVLKESSAKAAVVSCGHGGALSVVLQCCLLYHLPPFSCEFFFVVHFGFSLKHDSSFVVYPFFPDLTKSIVSQIFIIMLSIYYFVL